MEDEKKKEIVEVQENYISKLTSRINEQMLEIADLHKKNSLIFQQIGELEQIIAEKEDLLQEMKEKQEQAIEEKNQLAAEKEELIKNENKKIEKQLQDHKKKIKDLSEENERLSRDVEAHAMQERILSEKIAQMENSKSWKITKPLRSLYWKTH